MVKVGKYEIVKELGHGATSTVYLALDPFNQQQVALKVFNLDVLRDRSRAKAYRKLLLTEASLAGKLSHPHIVKIYDAVMEGDVNYMVMEYIEGETLEKYGEVDHLMDLGHIAEIIYKCCKALDDAVAQTGHLVGSRLTYADMNVIPMLSTLLNFPAGKDILAKYSSLSAYVARLADLPSFKNTAPPPRR